jgi:hypothetical protein
MIFSSFYRRELILDKDLNLFYLDNCHTAYRQREYIYPALYNFFLVLEQHHTFYASFLMVETLLIYNPILKNKTLYTEAVKLFSTSIYKKNVKSISDRFKNL